MMMICYSESHINDGLILNRVTMRAYQNTDTLSWVNLRDLRIAVLKPTRLIF